MDSKVMDAKIDELNRRVNGMPLTTKDSDFWRETRSLEAEIWHGFKTTRYPTREEKDEAWQTFHKIVDESRAGRERHATQRATQVERSAALTRKIFARAQAAWPREDGFESLAMAVTGLAIAQLLTHFAGEIVRDLFGMKELTPSEREKRRLTELSNYMRRAWNTFTAEKQFLTHKDKGDCFNLLEAVQTELNKAWEEWRQEGQIEWQKREEVLERKRDEKRRVIEEMRSLVENADGKEATTRAGALMAEWKQIGFAGKGHDEDLWRGFDQARNSFWEARKQAQIAWMDGRIANQEAFLEKLQGSIEHLEGVLSDKRERLDNVFDGRRADEIRENLESSIASLEEKIESKRTKADEIEADIADLRQRIRSMR